MKVLFVQGTSHREGHFADYVTHICDELGREGHEVTVCTDRLRIEKHLRTPPHFTLHEVAGGKYDFHEVELRKGSYPFDYELGYLRNSFVVFREALKLLKTGNFDILHITGIEFLIFSTLVGLHSGPMPPVIMEIYAANWTNYPKGTIRRWYKNFQREIFRRTLGPTVRAIMTLGEWHVDRLRQQLRLAPDFPIRVVTEGVEIPPTIPKPEARRKIGLEGYAGTIFLFFGTIRRDKNLFALLEAARKLGDREYRLVIAGSPTHFTREKIEAAIVESGVGPKVISNLGYIADEAMSDYYFASDVVVLPYARIYSGGSGPLRKACAHGRPLIVTNVSEMGRLTAAKNLGHVAQADDSDDLMRKMTTFLDEPEATRAIYAANALEIASENSWGTMARSFGVLYNDVKR